MARPALGSFAEELYARLAPFHQHTMDGQTFSDEDFNWAILTFFGSMAKAWQRLDDITADDDNGTGAWSSIVDIDRIEDAGLPYLSQFKGATLLPGLTPDQERERIRNVDGFSRCTAESIKEASRRRLTGTKTVILNEREGGNALWIGVVTYDSETPEPDLTFLDMMEQKPWGYILDYQVVDEWGYQVLKIAFDNYGEVKTHYPNYAGVKVNVPPASTI